MPERRITINGGEVGITFIEGFKESDEMAPILKRKLIPRDELKELGDFLRRRGNGVSFTTGVFDMLHHGHARYLQLARSLGDALVVGVNTDNSVRRLKGPDRPILDEMRRAEMLSYLGIVDYITLFGEDTGADTIDILRPKYYLCVEGSWEGDLAAKAEVVAMARIGGSVFYTPKQGPTISTSAIITRISLQAIEKVANELPKLVAESLKF